MNDSREVEIELPHLRLAARAWGDPALPKLLAVHGWLDNAASFDALAPLLCGHFHIVALDLAGHGRSAHRPPGLWYHYVDYLGDVLAAADALGWQHFSLLGHSLGGAIASMLAGVEPARVERLLLIEALGPMRSWRICNVPWANAARPARCVCSRAKRTRRKHACVAMG